MLNEQGLCILRMDVSVAIQSLSCMELGEHLSSCTECLCWLETWYTSHDSKLPLQLISRDSSTHHACWRSNNADARILLMLNIVTPNGLTDDDGYSDLSEDMGISKTCAFLGQEDTSKWALREHGQQTTIEAQHADEAAGVGRVYVKYVDVEGAQTGLKVLAGRSMAGCSIFATVLDADSQTTPSLNL
ncbi:hypothetical protein EV702DRAFT_1141204, partial [Suillus placidus]